MALNAYLNLTGQKQGPMKGSVTQKGREDKIMVVEFDHDIVSPRDAASGLPTGKRQHKPVRIQCEIDKATPLLYNALVNNENITEWELQFWRPSQTGAENQYYSIKLTNANLSQIHAHTANNKIPELMRLPDMVTYYFTYQKIEWTWTDGGIMASDDWEAPVV
jgi:type VI secretion system secreted protein Hcp